MFLTVCFREVRRWHWSSFPFHSHYQEALSQSSEFIDSTHFQPQDGCIGNPLLLLSRVFVSIMCILGCDRPHIKEAKAQINKYTNENTTWPIQCLRDPGLGLRALSVPCRLKHLHSFALYKKKGWLQKQCHWSWKGEIKLG